MKNDKLARRSWAQYTVVLAFVLIVRGAAADETAEAYGTFRILDGHRGAIVSLAFCNEGELVSADDAGKIFVWQLRSGKIVQRIKAFDRQTDSGVSFDPKSRHLFAFSLSKIVEFGRRKEDDSESFEKLPPTRFSGMQEFWECRSVLFSNDGKMMVGGFSRYGPRVQNVGEIRNDVPPLLIIKNGESNVRVNKKVLEFLHGCLVQGLAMSRTGDLLAICGIRPNRARAGFVIELDLGHDDVTFIGEPSEFVTPANCVAFSPDGNRFAVGFGSERSENNKDSANVMVFSSRSCMREYSGFGGRGVVFAMAFSADSNRLYVGGSEPTLQVLTAPNWRTETRLIAHKSSIKAMAVSEHDGVLATGASDGSIIIWTLKK